MTEVAGVDCSTQSTKVVVCDAASGRVLAERSAPHPDGTEVDPQAWWRAFETASAGLLDGAAAVAVGGQQHGLVALDEAGEVVRPALLWNDVRSAGAAVALIRELGGPGAWAGAVGSVPVASFTVSKLRWLAEHEPERAGRVASVLLPHDWVTWRLTGEGEPVTDRGDASGTGYWSPRSVTGSPSPVSRQVTQSWGSNTEATRPARSGSCSASQRSLVTVKLATGTDPTAPAGWPPCCSPTTG